MLYSSTMASAPIQSDEGSPRSYKSRLFPNLQEGCFHQKSQVLLLRRGQWLSSLFEEDGWGLDTFAGSSIRIRLQSIHLLCSSPNELKPIHISSSSPSNVRRLNSQSSASTFHESNAISCWEACPLAPEQETIDTRQVLSLDTH